MCASTVYSPRRTAFALQSKACVPVRLAKAPAFVFEAALFLTSATRRAVAGRRVARRLERAPAPR